MATNNSGLQRRSPVSFSQNHLDTRRRRLVTTAAVFALTLVSSFAATTARATNAVGAIKGQFSVDANGAANYSIPLDLPAGPRGLTPKLALTYNSQSGPGLAGYGWTLSGLSAITRCGWTIAQDGNPQAIMFADGAGGDDYCLDGQKLRPDGSGNYRKEIDDFSLATPYTSGGQGPATSHGPEWFQVKTKDGLTYKYGYTADSEILAVGPGFNSSCTNISPVVVRVWALSSITDPSGNGITFKYANDNATTCSGDYWISSITYGGSTGSQHQVTFTYDNMAAMSPLPADVKTSYRGGAAVGHTQRLNGINVLYNNSAPIISYSLQYQLDPATQFSELKTVTECAVDGCYPATTIAWPTASSTPGWTVTKSSVTTNYYYYLHPYSQTLDAFGTGAQVAIFNDTNYMYLTALQLNASATDLIKSPSSHSGYFYDGTNYYTDGWPLQYFANSTYSWLQTEANADGSATLHVDTFAKGSAQTMTLVDDHDTKIIPKGTANDFLVADVNGDGRDDVIWPGQLGNGDAGFIVALNGPSGISNPGGSSGQWLYDSGVAAGNNPPWLAGPQGYQPYIRTANGVTVADFDGDGRTDLLLDWGKVFWAMVSTGTQTTPQLQQFSPITDADSNYPVLTLDVNGDGLTDLAYVCLSGASDCKAGDWVLAVSSGGASGGFIIHDSGQVASVPSGTYAIDYEGDGRQDLMEPINGEWYVLSAQYKPGSGGAAGYYVLSSPIDSHLNTSELPNPADPSTASNYFPTAMGDFNGDGLYDFMTQVGNPGNIYFELHNPSALRVSSITDGLGNSVSVNYASISGVPSAGIYTPAATVPSYPTSPFPGPLFVVSKYQANDGVKGDSPYTVSYAYQGAARDLQGRGFLGFQQITQTDNRIGEATVTTYRQDFPYIGRIAEQTVKNSGGGTQIDTTNAYATIGTSGSGYTAAIFPYVQTSTATTYGSDGHDAMAGVAVKTVKTTDTYDSWGNLTQVTIDTNPGTAAFFEENILSHYVEDTSANHCLSFPDKVTVARAFGTAGLMQGTTPAPNNGGSYSSQARETDYGVDTVHCRVTSKTADAYEAGMSVVTNYLYTDAWGNVNDEQVSDSSGKLLRETVYDYSGAASDGSASDGVHPTTITYKNATTGVNLQTTQVWDQTLGVLKAKTDVNNSLTTSWSYDGFARGKQETEPDGSGTQYGYGFCPGSTGCAVNAAYVVYATPFASDGSVLASSLSSYDSFGRVVETGKPVLGGQLSYEDTQYNALGLTTSVTVPHFAGASGVTSTTTVYDNLNRPALVTKPNGTTVNLCYNAGSCSGGVPSGQVPYAISQVAAMSGSSDAPATEATLRIADSQGNIVEVDDAAGKTGYGADAFGEVISVTDPAANVSTMDYDSVGHKIDQHDPDMGVWKYGYDALGDLLSQTDANGNTATQLWDNLGRRYSRTESGPNGNATYNWTYDSTAYCVGKLGSETNNAGYTKVYNCDAKGRSSGSDTTIGGTDYNVALSYDNFGRVQTVTYPVSVTPAANSAAPTAVATATPTTLTLGASVTLDGSQSTPNDSSLQYQWTQTGGPVQLSVWAFDSASAKTSFTPPVTGTYTFQLQVIDTHTTLSAPASVSVAVVPPVPAAPSVPAYNYTGSYTVSWATVSGADTYLVYQSYNGAAYANTGGSYSCSGNGCSATLSNMGSATYSYEIIACGHSVCSAASPASGTVTETLPPTGLSTNPSGTSSNGSFTLSWTSVPTATYYLVFQSVNGGSYAQLTQVSQPAAPANPSYAISAGSGNYSYEVEACNAGGCSPLSSPVSETVPPPPGAPSVPTFSNNPSTNGVYNVAWGTVSVSGEPAVTYHLEEAAGNSSGPTTGYTEIWSGTNNWLNSINHSNNASYYYWYRVRAQDLMGYGPYSAASSIHVVVPPSAPYLNPASQTVAPGATYTLTWGGSGPIVSYYQLYASMDDDTFAHPNLAYQGTGTLASFSKSLAYNTHDFYYEVRACNTSDGYTACGPYSTITDIYIFKSGGAVLWKDSAERLASSGGGHPSTSAASGDLSSADASSVAFSSVTRKRSNSIAAIPLVISASVAASPIEAIETTSGARLDPVPVPAMLEPARVADVLQKMQQERRLIAAQPLQPSEAAFQAGADRRSATLMPAVVPPAATGMQPFQNPVPVIPGQPTYAPPVYAAYADARIQNVTGNPYRFAVVYSYDPASGVLEAVSSADTGFIYWRAATSTGLAPVDAFGHLIAYTDGNNDSTVSAYDPATGNLTGLSTGVGQNSAIQFLVYAWDGYGNLISRCDTNAKLLESFSYDGLNRLTNSAAATGVTVGSGANPCSGGTAGQSLAASYDALGNISSKTLPGTGTLATYTYGNAGKPHQVTTVTGISGTFSYDANGNLLSGNGETLTWNGDNLPTQISASAGSSSFSYGPDLQHYFQSATDGTGTITTTYVDNLFEVVSTASGTQYRHNILAGSQTVAVHTLTSAGVVTTSYLHPDHLGGIDSVTSDSGSLAQKMSFDAFGARRDPCTWGYVTACDQGSGLKSVTDRGYTSQEQLDNLGLVHMNGRVYDPSLGRFMSADPRIPDLYNSQDLNRYAYVNNNPLNSTDPSGFDGEDPPPLPSGTTDFNIYWNPTTGWAGNVVVQQPSLEGAGNLPGALPSGSNPTGNSDSTLYGSLTAGVLGGLFAPAGAGFVASGIDASTTYTPAVGDVFNHFSTDNLGDNETPSPLDAGTEKALETYLSSPGGMEVATYAIAHGNKFDIAEMPYDSETPMFGVHGNDLIVYTLNGIALLNSAATKNPGILKQFAGLSGSNLIADLFAHEIAHTTLGELALGKPHVSGFDPGHTPSLDDYKTEEFNAVKYGENPFREFIGAPLRTEYTFGFGTFAIPGALVVEPGH